MTSSPFQPPDGDRDDDADLVLPPRLLAGLRATDRTPAVPSAVDAAVRRHAIEYFARQRRVRNWTRWAGAAAAAAAIVLVALRLASPPDNGTGGTAQTPSPSAGGAAASPRLAARTSAPEDVNGDGVVDVLDAFAVARGVRAGRPPAAWDVTGDGVVDRQDVDRIAARAVAAPPALVGSPPASPASTFPTPSIPRPGGAP
jgi:hypothetical protein